MTEISCNFAEGTNKQMDLQILLFINTTPNKYCENTCFNTHIQSDKLKYIKHLDC